jgi:hypothetical protein
LTLQDAASSWSRAASFVRRIPNAHVHSYLRICSRYGCGPGIVGPSGTTAPPPKAAAGAATKAATSQPAKTGASTAASAASAATKLLNINTASAAALAGLPGLSKDLASKIIGGRPYSDIAQLVSKKILNQATFDKIKSLITVK